MQVGEILRQVQVSDGLLPGIGLVLPQAWIEIPQPVEPEEERPAHYEQQTAQPPPAPRGDAAGARERTSRRSRCGGFVWLVQNDRRNADTGFEPTGSGQARFCVRG